MVGVKCPKCGLMQMPRPTCKSCGAPLSVPELRHDAGAARAERTAFPSTPLESSPTPQPQIPRPETFSIEESIRFGWSTMRANLGFFVFFLIVVGLIYVIPGILAELGREDLPVLSVILGIVSGVLQIIVGMGLIRIALRFCDNEQGSLSDLFSCAPLFIKYLLGSILYGLIVLGGLILLVVPGVIWAIKYMFFSYFIVDRELGPVEALKRSAQITQGAKGDLFLLGLALAGINLLGALALLIGLFATVPTAMVATAFAYRKLAALRGAAQ
jgi:uncharacterized membrane protein